jgi:hypothetical protein
MMIQGSGSGSIPLTNGFRPLTNGSVHLSKDPDPGGPKPYGSGSGTLLQGDLRKRTILLRDATFQLVYFLIQIRSSGNS